MATPPGLKLGPTITPNHGKQYYTIKSGLPVAYGRTGVAVGPAALGLPTPYQEATLPTGLVTRPKFTNFLRNPAPPTETMGTVAKNAQAALGLQPSTGGRHAPTGGKIIPGGPPIGLSNTTRIPTDAPPPVKKTGTKPSQTTTAPAQNGPGGGSSSGGGSPAIVTPYTGSPYYQNAPTPIVITRQPTASTTTGKHKLLLLGGVVLVVGGGLWIWYKHKKGQGEEAFQ